MATFEPRLDTSIPFGLCKELCLHRTPDPPTKQSKTPLSKYLEAVTCVTNVEYRLDISRAPNEAHVETY